MVDRKDEIKKKQLVLTRLSQALEKSEKVELNFLQHDKTALHYLNSSSKHVYQLRSSVQSSRSKKKKQKIYNTKIFPRT